MTVQRLLLCALAAAAANLAHATPDSAAKTEGAALRRISVDSGAGKHGDGPEKLVARLSAPSMGQRVVSTNGMTEMLLSADSAYLQMTDLALKQMGQPQAEADKSQGLFESMVKNVALSAVRHMFEHGIALHMRDIRSATVRNGEVVVTACNGKEVFSQVKINDSVQTYPQAAANAFVRKLMQARAQHPACAT